MKTPTRIKSSLYSGFKDVTKKWLEYQHIELRKSASEISKMLNVHQDTVKVWLRKHNIKRLPICQLGENGPFKYIYGKRVHYEGITKEWLEYHYITLNKSTNDILDEFGISRASFCKWLKKFEIKKSPEQLAVNHSKRMSGSGNPAWNGGTARNYQVRFLESFKVKKCEWCNAIEKVQIHHIDHNKDNGNLDNLTWLCGYCNRLESNLWALQQRNRATFTFDSLGKKLIIEFQDNSLMEV